MSKPSNKYLQSRYILDVEKSRPMVISPESDGAELRRLEKECPYNVRGTHPGNPELDFKDAFKNARGKRKPAFTIPPEAYDRIFGG